MGLSGQTQTVTIGGQVPQPKQPGEITTVVLELDEAIMMMDRRITHLTGRLERTLRREPPAAVAAVPNVHRNYDSPLAEQLETGRVELCKLGDHLERLLERLVLE